MDLFFSVVIVIIKVVATYGEVINHDYHLISTEQKMMLPLDEQHYAESHVHCAAKCSTSTNECYNFIYDESTQVCSLGHWILPTVAVNQSTSALKSSSTIYTRGKSCDARVAVTPIGNGRMGSCNTAACIGSIQVASADSYIPNTQNVYKSCNDLRNTTNPRQLLQLPSGLIVMCDTATDGGGWTIFQRRISGLVDFYRNWTTYRDGFGDYDIGNFYLGNENIYCLTSKAQHVLRFDMTFKGKSYYATYSTFTFLNESLGYKLSVGLYSGTALDSLVILNNNQVFSTYDKDPTGCARLYRGAWWYSACHYTHLNGVWGSKDFGVGLNWLGVTGQYDSVDSCEIKIRPV